MSVKNTTNRQLIGLETKQILKQMVSWFLLYTQRNANVTVTFKNVTSTIVEMLE